MGARRSLQRLFAAMLSGSLVATAIAVGCATGADAPSEVPAVDSGGPSTDSSFADAGGDGGKDGSLDGKPGDTKPLFDSDLFCGDVGLTNSCDRVTDLGSVPLGGSGGTAGNIPLTGGDVWYKLTFESLDNPAAHPHIELDGPDGGFGFRFEVVQSCAREAFTCGETEEASPSKLTEFENSYADATAADDSDAFVPITLGPGGVVYVRVYRSGSTPTACDGYTLKISN